MRQYLERKQSLKNSGCIIHCGNYAEVSDRIKKVTYNTDFFDRTNFERRVTGTYSFNFDSGKIGKFIECEFDSPIKICMSKLTSIEEA
jgi:hypothetical protein